MDTVKLFLSLPWRVQHQGIFFKPVIKNGLDSLRINYVIDYVRDDSPNWKLWRDDKEFRMKILVSSDEITTDKEFSIAVTKILDYLTSVNLMP